MSHLHIENVKYLIFRTAEGMWKPQAGSYCEWLIFVATRRTISKLPLLPYPVLFTFIQTYPIYPNQHSLHAAHWPKLCWKPGGQTKASNQVRGLRFAHVLCFECLLDRKNTLLKWSWGLGLQQEPPTIACVFIYAPRDYVKGKKTCLGTRGKKKSKQLRNF